MGDFILSVQGMEAEAVNAWRSSHPYQAEFVKGSGFIVLEWGPPFKL